MPKHWVNGLRWPSYAARQQRPCQDDSSRRIKKVQVPRGHFRHRYGQAPDIWLKFYATGRLSLPVTPERITVRSYRAPASRMIGFRNFRLLSRSVAKTMRWEYAGRCGDSRGASSGVVFHKGRLLSQWALTAPVARYPARFAQPLDGANPCSTRSTGRRSSAGGRRSSAGGRRSSAASRTPCARSGAKSGARYRRARVVPLHRVRTGGHRLTGHRGWRRSRNGSRRPWRSVFSQLPRS